MGTYRYLKNYRKGLHHQLVRCRSELEAATASWYNSGAEACRHRLAWIFEKQRFLDEGHEYITDKPAWDWKSGKELAYGSLAESARHALTDQEIAWNQELIDEEA